MGKDLYGYGSTVVLTVVEKGGQREQALIARGLRLQTVVVTFG